MDVQELRQRNSLYRLQLIQRDSEIKRLQIDLAIALSQLKDWQQVAIAAEAKAQQLEQHVRFGL